MSSLQLSWLNGVVAWWRNWRCEGKLIPASLDDLSPEQLANLLDQLATSSAPNTAGGNDIDATEPRKLLWIACPNGRSNCERCPRFQSYWQLAKANNRRWAQGYVLGRAKEFEASRPNGDCEVAEVHDLDGQAFNAPHAFVKEHHNPYPQVNAIPRPGAPGVVHPEHCTNQSRPLGEPFGKALRHVGSIRQAGNGTLSTFAAALVIALILASLGPALDGIDDHSTEWRQAEDIQAALIRARDEQRFAAAAQDMCGPQAAWQQLADGSVQCRTKHGRPTITVQVSP